MKTGSKNFINRGREDQFDKRRDNQKSASKKANSSPMGFSERLGPREPNEAQSYSTHDDK